VARFALTVFEPRGWRRFVDAPAAHFELLPQERWEALAGPDKEAYDEARLSYHSEMIIVATSTIREVARQGRLLTLLNRREVSALSAQARTAGVRVGQEEAEHDEVHRDQRRQRPAAVDGPDPSGADARRHRPAHRRDRGSLHHHPDVKARADSGYQGLARDFPGQVTAPPKKPSKDATAEDAASYEQARHQQSSQRICVEHAIAEPKQWRPMQRWTGRRNSFEETSQAVAGLVSDRTAKR
jgi:hypothetical protein